MASVKTTLAVLGDSYMRPDGDYPGLHFSEMFDQYDVRIYAQDGASMGMIAYQFHRAIEDNMQAFVIGLGAHDRLEFEAQEDHGDHQQQRLWYCGNNHALAASEQMKASQLYQLYACDGMSNFKALLAAKSIFLDLEKRNIPFVWTWNLNSLNDHDRWYWLHGSVLKAFIDRCTKLNLATYRPFVSKPGFHVVDRSWQQTFAQQCQNILGLDTNNDS